ncbi:probable inositol-1(or 4)-monophosphatase / fructose-1,6-bisphosphatase, archaeal-type [Natronomonas moolapensis 8.8.11]|uniref:fructose-bisphosphatase n=1 Tax=Natronomonas moolapensis (strain DSM 18674 / CECT 7526 / JCM 14361 / 8.8.11) TaxID=268739 RepID=M1Y367_NATM8|nr:inositol monophosphatase family protein [Natronomonas moolapensis]CCQ36952.1 probable inositol-1(or 4)-monophosphatase / fructose-1,6-bisphosphatase, archaeal-type [Natronomonas moolapensis 8.8.11]
MGTRADCAHRAAEAGAALAAESFRGELTVETKAEKTDVVTRADRDAQRRVVDVIGASFDDEPIVGEEDEPPSTVPEDGPGWVIDPIDGTANYVRESRSWATSVAATADGEAIAGATVAPALGDTFVLDSGEALRNGETVAVSDRTDPETFAVVPTMWWGPDRRDEYGDVCRGIVERFGDMRRVGSAQLELALCAVGAVEAVVTNVETNPWDTLVGAGLVEAAGGTVTDIHGKPWRHDSRGLVASNGAAHGAVLDAARTPETPPR